ncbi:YiiD C-terminal domain-containing protein [Candidatus Riflebacteria bacterium]
MNIIDIPFNKHIAIQVFNGDDGLISLPYSLEMTNHLGTFHASAQFALAEACSGQFMLRRFPEYVERYIAVLRKSDVKYKKQTKARIYAMATVDEDIIQAFRDKLDRKNRSLLPIRVTIKDEEENITMQATFEWYVQAI